MAFAIVTVRAHLPRVGVLVDSIAAFEPDADVVVVVADDGPCEMRGVADAAVIPVHDLRLPGRARRALLGAHGADARFALAPFLIGALLGRGHRRVVHVADDACLHRSISSLIAAAGPEGPAVVPRRLDAPADGAADTSAGEAGFFDPGLVGLADSLTCARFLRWWRREVEAGARSAIVGEPVPLPVLDAGLLWFGHQRVIDPGLGVARWNRDERALRRGVHGWEVRGHPLRLVRYEGLVRGEPEGPWADIAGQHAGWVAARARASGTDQADTEAR